MPEFTYTSGKRKFTRTRNSLNRSTFTLTGATSVTSSFDIGKYGSLQFKAEGNASYIKPEMLIGVQLEFQGGKKFIILGIVH